MSTFVLSIFLLMTSVESLTARVASAESMLAKLSAVLISNSIVPSQVSSVTSEVGSKNESFDKFRNELVASLEQILVQVQATEQENTKLKAEVVKLNYRVNHLIKSLEAEERNNK